MFNFALFSLPISSITYIVTLCFDPRGGFEVKVRSHEFSRTGSIASGCSGKRMLLENVLPTAARGKIVEPVLQ